MLLRQVRHWGRAAGDSIRTARGFTSRRGGGQVLACGPPLCREAEDRGPGAYSAAGCRKPASCVAVLEQRQILDRSNGRPRPDFNLAVAGDGLVGGGGAAGALRPRFIPLGIGRAGLAGSVGGLVGTGAWLPSRPSRCCGLSMGVGAARGPMSIRRDEVKIGRARGCPAQSQRRHRVYPGHRCCPAPTKTACARMSAGCSAWALSRSFTCCVLRLPVQM